MDKHDYRAKQIRGIFWQEGLLCYGTLDFRPWERSYFFSWHEAWLGQDRAKAQQALAESVTR